MRLNKKLRLGITIPLLITLWIFRFEMILPFQLQTLRNMGCDIDRRVSKHLQKSSKKPFCSKLWVHRVNSLPRFEILKDDFTGFELDVVFVPDSGSFYVRHPPDAVNDLELESYMQAAATSGKSFWIDIKDLHENQHIQALKSLIRLKSLTASQGQIIVESSDPNFVNLLAHNGFTCSYLSLENRVSAGAEKETLEVTLDSAVKYVSGSESTLSDLKLKYPGKKYLIWSLTAKNFYDTKNIKTFLADPDVEVVLLNIKSRYYR